MDEPESTNAESPDLVGRVALVTGGSRGLGREIAKAYAARGAEVVVASRKQDACDALAAELTQRHGVPSHGVACHVGRWEDVERLFDTVISRCGALDILVNNAGMSPTYGSLTDVSEQLFDKVIGVNLKGPFRLSTLAAEHMRDRGNGAILNITSVSAVRPSAREVVYAAAKAGLNVMTEALAREYGPQVRVNAIMPGAFRTDIAAAWDDDAVARDWLPGIALGRLGEPHEIVGAAMWLTSDASSYATGSVVRLDGGWFG